MKKLFFGCAIITSLLMSSNVMAINKRYIATPAQSKWKMTENTPLECRLVHSIPNFGDAEFSSHASKKINLDFLLKMRRPMGSTRNVSLISMPPAWNPGENAERITSLKFFKQFDGYVDGQDAWGMLSELEKGRVPTFSYRDWQSRDELIEVALSPILFQKPYNAFNECIANLLKYSFEDIAFTILHYQRHGDQLTNASKKRLSQIADYIKNNKDIDLVLVNAYTDNTDGKATSQTLSDRRAESLREYFKSLGLHKDRIQVQGYGRRRPVADNATPMGKDRNRRVVISLGRTPL